MDLLTKEKLARRHDDSVEACAIRLRAARLMTGLSQADAATEAGASNTALNNAERARNYPQTKVMRWLYRAHRVDFNFLLAGEFSQLPADVQSAIFAILSDMNETPATDQKSN